MSDACDPRQFARKPTEGTVVPQKVVATAWTPLFPSEPGWPHRFAVQQAGVLAASSAVVAHFVTNHPPGNDPMSSTRRLAR
jgi:hypothetical protein